MKTLAINIETIMGNETQPSAQTMSHIQKMWSDNTGGGCMVDFIELEDGKLITINEETLCFSKSYDEWSNGDHIESIYLTIPDIKNLNDLLKENEYPQTIGGSKVPEGSHVYEEAEKLINEANEIMDKMIDISFDHKEFRCQVLNQIVVWYRG